MKTAATWPQTLLKPGLGALFGSFIHNRDLAHHQ
jgi:hypothetical protein